MGILLGGEDKPAASEGKKLALFPALVQRIEALLTFLRNREKGWP